MLVLTAASLGYVLLAMARLRAFAAAAGAPPGARPPLTVLKPVCGLDAGLYENLRSFCLQDYPRFQVIFGVADEADPALPVLRRLQAELGHHDIDIVVDPRLHGANRKISNLVNMSARARHDILVIADSDMRVGPDYLSAVAAPFGDPAVGAVTCLYTGTATGNLASVLGAAYINECFLPSVLVATAFGRIDYCFGATMCVRREVLAAFGGFERLACVLADDYMLGRLVAAQGRRVVLSHHLVENLVHEPSLRALFLHELRWARTVRSVQPVGFAFSFLSYAVPMAFLNLLAAAGSGLSLALLGAAVALRVRMHYTARRCLRLSGPARPWLAPLRDILCFVVWAASFLGRTVRWRDGDLRVQTNGDIVFKESTS